MLEAITDFWKPVKKVSPPKIKLIDMQIGTVVSFGFVPQSVLSGRKLTVTAINSYQFGKDVLTSFVLGSEKGEEVSMIIAEAQGEQYLAISRRIAIKDREKLFDAGSIEIITGKNEAGQFTCKDNIPELKGWLVSNYKREIQGMRGYIHHADFRDGSEVPQSGKEFQYTLLGSSSNEHAIEIESYQDGHVDVYATVYRRTSDINEVIHQAVAREDVKLTLVNEPEKPDEKSAAEPVAVKDVAAPAVVETPKAEPAKLEIVKEEAKAEPPKLESVKLELLALPELIITPLAPEIKKSETTPEAVKSEPKPALVKADKETAKENNITKNNNEEKKIMSTATNENKPINGTSGSDLKPVPSFGSINKDFIQEIKPVTKTTNGMENDSLECDLRIANQIIDEAIRNEMRLSDVVRRIIELPVAHQEAVQIPINLADEDYSLLAIRYGIPASDRHAIKLRIIQDLGDFSGSKKKVN